ncbi:MAG TPA: hypothetical protein VMD59_11945, partial [Acidimicrobiales bacterium]|nr:hypothetical protein [Acidimicrobiales bacterium]
MVAADELEPLAGAVVVVLVLVVVLALALAVLPAAALLLVSEVPPVCEALESDPVPDVSPAGVSPARAVRERCAPVPADGTVATTARCVRRWLVPTLVSASLLRAAAVVPGIAAASAMPSATVPADAPAP